MRCQFTNDRDSIVDSPITTPRHQAASVAAVLTALSPSVANAVGLGQLESFSALNQPFNARIELIDVAPGEVDALTVRLADSAQFERAGIARTAALLQLDLRIEHGDRGRDYVLITTREPYREPFLNFLLELNSSNGRLVREYTVLLDPPPVAARRQVQPVGREAAPVTVATRERQIAASAPRFTGSEYGPTANGDTLWSIAAASRPDSSITVHQMMMALLRANPHAFINGNINVLRRGVVLRVPETSEITSLSATEAVAEVRQQNELWQGYRQESSAAPAPQPVLASGGRSDVGAGRATPSEQARLDIVAPRGEATGDDAAGAASGNSQARLLEERLDAVEQETGELRAKLTEADEIIDLLQRQIDIKDNELATLQNQLSEPGSEVESAEPVPARTPERESPGPAAQSAPKPTITAPEKEGLLARIPGGIAAVGAVAALLLLVGGWFARQRFGRRETPEWDRATTITAGAAATAPALASHEEKIEVTQPPTMPLFAEEAADEQVPASADLMATIEAEPDTLTIAPSVEDPLEDVNVYLAYERFDQAEELVRNAIAKYPDESGYKLRLLEVFYSANDPRKYEEAARILRDAVGEASPLWESALAMWNEMSPKRKLFEEGAEFSTMILPPGAAQTFVDLTAGDAGAEPDLAERTLVGLPPLVESHAGDDVEFELTGIGDDLSVGDEESAFDFTATMEDELIDLTSAAAQPKAPDEFVDVTAQDGQVQAETMFDVTGRGADETLSIEEDMLDITGGEHAEEDEFPSVDLADTSDLLDVTRSGDLSGADDLEPLNVTSPGGDPGKAESLLDITRSHFGDTHETVQPSPAATGTIDFDISESIAPIFSDTNLGQVPAESDLSLDFDIGGQEIEEVEAQGFEDDFDLSLETTGDLELMGADLAQAETKQGAPLDFDLTLDDAGDETETVGRIEVRSSSVTGHHESDDATASGDLDLDALLGEAKRSMQSLELDDDEDIEFDLSLEDTGELSAFHGSNFELPNSDETDAAGIASDETLADLTSSMEDTVAGLEVAEDDLERSLDLGARVEEDIFHSTISPDGATLRGDAGSATMDADEVDTKLNLAKAYVELGDANGARAILDEVIADGSDEQRVAARQLLDQLSAQ